MFNGLKLVVVALAISGCTANTMQRAQYEKSGSPDDVRFCQYEAVKAGTGAYVTRSAVGNGIEDADRQAQVFNACMKYKQGL